MSPGVNEDTKKHLLDELADIEKQLEDLTKPEKTPVEPFIFSSLHLFTGMLFLILFFVTVNSNLLAQQIIAAGSLFIASTLLLKVLADILNEKQITAFLGFLFLIILFSLGVSFYILWTSFIVEILTPAVIVLATIFLIEIIFFMFHAYIAFMKRTGSYEIKLTSVIALIGIIILLANFLYNSMVLFLLLFITIFIFAKANFDFLELLRK